MFSGPLVPVFIWFSFRGRVASACTSQAGETRLLGDGDGFDDFQRVTNTGAALPAIPLNTFFDLFPLLLAGVIVTWSWFVPDDVCDRLSELLHRSKGQAATFDDTEEDKQLPSVFSQVETVKH